MRAKDVTETLNLLIHAIKHLANGADFYIAVFELLEGETDGEVFGQLHKHGFIGFGLGGLGRQTCDGLAQCGLRGARQLRDLLLECAGAGNSTLTGSDLTETCERAKNSEHLSFTGGDSSSVRIAWDQAFWHGCACGDPVTTRVAALE